MTLPLSDHTPAYETANLSTCDREPIHVPGAIQPHGLLLALDLEERVELGVGGRFRHFRSSC